MKNKRSIGLILILCIILTGGLAWYLQSVPQQAPKQDITIDPGHTAASTLLLVARDKGYFAQHSLNVTFVESPSAAVAISNLLKHTCDFGFVNEYTLSEPSLYNTTVRAVGTLAESDVNFVVSRRDRGIVRVSDLEGKRIGVTKGSIGEYYMDRFFVLNGLSPDNTTVIYLPPAALVTALAGGDIDASFSPEPYVYQMQKQMGENVVVWPVNLGQHARYSLICDGTTLLEHPEIVEGVLASVIQAETYVNSHPEDAKSVARRQTNFDEQYMDQDWKNHRFSVGLSQSLITSMEDETRWRIHGNLTDAKEIPDFSNIIYPGTLQRLKPSSVTLIQ